MSEAENLTVTIRLEGGQETEDKFRRIRDSIPARCPTCGSQSPSAASLSTPATSGTVVPSSASVVSHVPVRWQHQQ